MLGLPLHDNVYYCDLPEEIQKDLWGRFFSALQPLHAAGKLGAVHFQFDPGSPPVASLASWSSTALASWKARKSPLAGELSLGFIATTQTQACSSAIPG